MVSETTPLLAERQDSAADASTPLSTPGFRGRVNRAFRRGRRAAAQLANPFPQARALVRAEGSSSSVATAAASCARLQGPRRANTRRPPPLCFAGQGQRPAAAAARAGVASAHVSLAHLLRSQIYGLVLTAGLGGLLFGYDSSDIAIALPFIERSFPAVQRSNRLTEAVVSVTTLGAAFGAASGGVLADAVGRRTAIIVSDFIFVAAALLMGFAQTPAALIQGRVLMGVAIGLTSIVAPVYISECAPASYRATFVVCYSIEVGLGTSCAYLLDFAFTHTSLTWRLMLSASLVPALLQLCVVSTLPESPRWLAVHGRLGEALATAKGLAVDADDGAADAGELEAEFKRAEEERAQAAALASSGRAATAEEVEASSASRRSVAIQLALGIGLFLQNNFSGECALVYYSIEIISMAGVASEGAIAHALVCIGGCATAGVFLGIFLIDRLGRRKLLLASSAGTCVGLVLLAASYALARAHSPPVRPPRSFAFAATPPPGVACASPAPTCATCIASRCDFCGQPFGSEAAGAAVAGLCLARAADGGTSPAAVSACGAAFAAGGAAITPSAAATDTSSVQAAAAQQQQGFPSSPPPYYTGADLYREGCPSGLGRLTLASLCLFQFFFQLGLGIVPAAVNAELYPNSSRGLCNGAAVAVSWLGSFAVASTFLSAIDAIGAPGMYAIFATIVGAGCVATQLLLPETVGLSFDEIQALFDIYARPGAPPPWKLHAHMISQRLREEDAAPPESPRSGFGSRRASAFAAKA